jgi:fatty acid desaturase
MIGVASRHDAHDRPSDPAHARWRGVPRRPAAAGRGAQQRRRPLPQRALLFPHHVNHHLEHHLYPAVPHDHLPKLQRLLVEKGALQSAEWRDTSATLRRVFAPRGSLKIID